MVSLARANVGFHWKLFLSAVSVLALSGCLIYIAVGVTTANLRAISAFERTLDVDAYLRVGDGGPPDSLNRFLSDIEGFDEITHYGSRPRASRDQVFVEGSDTPKRINFYVIDATEDALMVPRLITPEARRALQMTGTMLASEVFLETNDLEIGDVVWNRSRDFGIEIVGRFSSSIDRGFMGQGVGNGFISPETAQIFKIRSSSYNMGDLTVLGLKFAPSLDPARTIARLKPRLKSRFLDIVAPEDFRQFQIARTVRENKALQGFLLMGVFAILIPLIIIVQTLRAAIASQSSQFATLRALGIPSRHLISTAMEQALWVGLLGVGVSYLLMLTVQIGLKRHDIDMYVDGNLVVWVSVAIIVSATLAGVVSIFAIFKMKPQDLLR